VYLGLTSLPDPISFLSVPPSFLHHLRNPEPSTTRDLAQPSKRGSVTSDWRQPTTVGAGSEPLHNRGFNHCSARASREWGIERWEATPATAMPATMDGGVPVTRLDHQQQRWRQRGGTEQEQQGTRNPNFDPLRSMSPNYGSFSLDWGGWSLIPN